MKYIIDKDTNTSTRYQVPAAPVPVLALHFGMSNSEYKWNFSKLSTIIIGNSHLFQFDPSVEAVQKI